MELPCGVTSMALKTTLFLEKPLKFYFIARHYLE